MTETKEKSEAAKKRSIARRFNDSLINRSARGVSEKSLDRRTAKRLERYRRELGDAKKNGEKDLTALDVASRIDELLKFGDKITELKKFIKPRVVDYNEDVLVGVLKEMHPIYKYRPEAYRFAGVRDEALVKAGVLDKIPTKRGPAPGSKVAKKEAAAKETSSKKAPAKKAGAKKTSAKKAAK